MFRMIPSLTARPILTAIVAAAALLAIIAAPAATASTIDPNLPRADRYLLNEWIGYSPPQFTDDLQWYGHDESGAPDWWSFHDRVVVLQSFTHTDDESLRRLGRVASRLKDYSSFDVQFIALHTPEDAESVNERRIRRIQNALPDGAIIAVDSSGTYCDKLGIFQHPVNLVTNRDGVVTHIGLMPDGVKDIVERLLDFEETVEPRRIDGDAEFPPFTGSVGNSSDVRGEKAPDVYVQEWVNGKPNCEGKITLVQFWRTGCPHCINAIPKFNDLAEKYGSDVCLVAITAESESALMSGLERRGRSMEDFKYNVAIDTSRRMTRAINVRGVPHAIAICSEGIVRWQGHPARLSEETLEQIIAADRKPEGDPPRDRWQKKLAASD